MGFARYAQPRPEAPDPDPAAVRAAIREVLQTDVATIWMLAGIVGASRHAVRLALAQLVALGEAVSDDHASEALRAWRIVPPLERRADGGEPPWPPRLNWPGRR